jgi:hypothetical protein
MGLWVFYIVRGVSIIFLLAVVSKRISYKYSHKFLLIKSRKATFPNKTLTFGVVAKVRRPARSGESAQATCVAL